MEKHRIPLLIEVSPFFSTSAPMGLPATGYQTWWVLTFLMRRGGESEIIALGDMVIVNYSLL